MVKLKREEMENLLKDGAAKLGLELSGVQLGQYLTYIDELKKWSGRINLTAVKDDRDIIVLHILDPIRFKENLRVTIQGPGCCQSSGWRSY